ncbi:Di-copper centre-containing protein [Naviculisporaceae sp. PSN 640]
MANSEPWDYVKIQGIPPIDGKPGIRKEFTAFATDKPDENIQLSLFIRALNRWYTKSHKDRLSYFQIASIHGYPGNLIWDNSEPPTFDRNKLGHYIYCTHNLVTFPTWHRPYMALFEQTLWQMMGEVIDEELEFPNNAEKQAWIDAKDAWRLPYWDWALPHYKGEVPEQFKPKEINIRKPANADGSLPGPAQVTNPLFRFQLLVDGKLTKMGDLPAPYTICDVNDKHSGKPEDTYPWSKCSGTSRYGITNPEPSEDESAGKNNTDGIAKAINAHQYYGRNDDPKDPTRKPREEISKLAVSDLVYRMLLGTPNPTWAEFSSTITGDPKNNPNWKEWISLEYIHNNLHVFIGGGDGWAQGIGHMMNVPVAAFDPIFFMHHCNIDHYMAVFQTIYGDSAWFTEDDSPRACDKLSPFHHDFGGTRGVDYFNSNDVKCWTDLGYQYDVLQRVDGETEKEYVQRVKDHVTAAYPHTGDVILRDRHKLFSSHGDQLGGAAFADKPVDDYLINIIYDRYGLNGGAPYTIHFFLGAAPLQVEINALGEFTTAGGVRAPKGIAELPRHVGSVFTFSSPMAPPSQEGGAESQSQCGNCRKQHDEGVLSRATVPLTITLYHDAANRDIEGFNNPFNGDAVQRYLADNLSWIAVNTRGIIIPWNELGKTKVYVLKGKGKHNYAIRNGFDGISSKYSHYEPLSAATHGKAAGASHEEYGQMVSGSA